MKHQAPFRLTPIDENYLHMASANQPMHVCLLIELSPEGDPLTIEGLRARVQKRALRFDVFRSVIRNGRLRKPRVEVAADWDPATNVIEARVHDIFVLRKWVAEHMDVPLSAAKPRWQVALVHVDQPAMQFIVVSVDHCLTDGVAAPGFLALIMDADDSRLDQLRFLTTERFEQPKVAIDAARSAILAVGRSWTRGRTQKRWPSISPASRRAVDIFSIPTSMLRDLTRLTQTSSTEYLLAALGQALSNVRADYAPVAQSARVLLSVTLDPHFRHTGNAVGLALVNVSLEVADLATRIRSSRAEIKNVAARRPELALPALSPGQRILPWPIRRGISRGVFRIIRPDVALSITPAFIRARTILGNDVARIYPLSPLAVYSLVVTTYTVGTDITFGITSDNVAVRDAGARLAAELERLIREQHRAVLTEAMVGL